MSTMIRKIETALAEAIKYRLAGSDIITEPGGERVAGDGAAP